MEVRILGPLEVWARDRQMEVGSGKQQALLVVLALDAPMPVSTDRLIEALWGESPPASALNSIRIYVSQLRKVLGESTVVTEGGGYRLALEPEDLDAHRFESLFTEARQLDDAEQQAVLLSSALELWRGPALSDFRYEAFAQTEIARLEELRLSSLEERIEADLALGRHDQLVPELDALVREHPLRERLRAQLMLALYRAGRQADALEQYQEGRRLLHEELGLDPGPALRERQQQILTQDPALAAPTVAPPMPARLRRRAPLLMAGGAALLLLAAATVVYAETRGETGGLAAVSPNAVGVIDPETNRIVAETPLPGTPARLAVGAGGVVWVGSDDARTISLVGGRTYQPTKVLAAGGFPSDMSVGAGALWMIDGRSGVLRKIDPVYATVAARTRVFDANPAYDASREGIDPISVAAGFDAVWLTDGSSELVRIRAGSARVADRIDLGTSLNGVAIGEDAVWAVSGPSGTVFRIDRDGAVTAHVDIVSSPDFQSPYPLAVRAGEGSVWVLNANTATVTRIDPQQRTVLATIPIGIEHAPARLAVGHGAAWVANRDGTLARVDADDNAVETISIGHRLEDVAVAAGAVFVTAGRGLSSKLGEGDDNLGETALQPLPTSACSPIYYGGDGRPRFLIASDLPLQGVGRAETAQMGQAIQFVLRQRGFKAGDYDVAYQSCDDATAAMGGAAPEKCEANAHAYADNPSLIGVVGTFNSFCTEIELPILNQASGGPVAMVSPGNTYVGLTRFAVGATAGEPEIYYPTGTRSYARVVAADDVQGAANALLAKQLGARRVVAIDDGSDYGRAVSASFALAGARLGLRVSTRTWSTDVPNEVLIAQVMRAPAEALFLGSALAAPGASRLVVELRQALPHATLLTPDGFSPPAALIAAVGPAAEGVTVSTAGVPNSHLSAAGRRFVDEFSAAVAEKPYQWPVSAAQATEVLLDAIARSDGTRASIARELLRTKVKNGILGDFSIDRNGDTTAGAITIYRVVQGVPRVYRVITPSPDLVR
jgi:DNA-binding SARP family transcriptional activator/ABC-type branched-subunit amino acid transport system substrate-binding protein/DNA-binding beta-propeller fold protein YncE